MTTQITSAEAQFNEAVNDDGLLPYTIRLVTNKTLRQYGSEYIGLEYGQAYLTYGGSEKPVEIGGDDDFNVSVTGFSMTRSLGFWNRASNRFDSFCRSQSESPVVWDEFIKEGAGAGRTVGMYGRPELVEGKDISIPNGQECYTCPINPYGSVDVDVQRKPTWLCQPTLIVHGKLAEYADEETGAVPNVRFEVRGEVSNVRNYVDSIFKVLQSEAEQRGQGFPLRVSAAKNTWETSSGEKRYSTIWAISTLAQDDVVWATGNRALGIATSVKDETGSLMTVEDLIVGVVASASVPLSYDEITARIDWESPNRDTAIDATFDSLLERGILIAANGTYDLNVPDVE